MVALLLNSALIYRFAAQRESDQFWVIHTFQVQLNLQEILTKLGEVVVDCRTYKITQDRVVLDEARKGANSALAKIDELQELTKDNIRQQQRIPNLRAFVAQRQPKRQPRQCHGAFTQPHQHKRSKAAPGKQPSPEK